MKNISILYVEDEKGIREVLSTFIAQFCATLYTASNGYEGLELYKKHEKSIDLVISDIQMPEMDGIGMIEAIKRINHGQAVIFVTALCRDETLYRAIELQVDAFVTKPIDFELLESKIKQILMQLKEKKSFNQLTEHLKILAQALEQMHEMVRITDAKGTLMYVNKALTENTLYSHEELIGQNNRIFQSGEHEIAFYENMWSTIMSKNIYSGVFTNKKKNGEFYYEDQTIAPIICENGEIEYFVSTGKDVTEQRALEKQLESLATIDSLTGIYNRYKINVIIDNILSRSKKKDTTVTLLMFDLDNFKDINDTYGHNVGDTVLQEFSTLISQNIRESDNFGRWGGEEFMLVCENLNGKAIKSFADKLCKKVATNSFSDIDAMTVSIGVVEYKNDETKEELLKRVDNALYKVKENGRNGVGIY